MHQQNRPSLVMSGLVLGTMAVGNLLSNYLPIIKLPFTALALFLYFLLIKGIITNKEQALKEIQSPLVSSVFPTFFMVGMLFSSLAIQLGLKVIGLPFWWLFVIGNLVLITYYCLNFVIKFSWENVYPSWTVLLVGIAMSTFTAPASQAFLFGKIVFWICLVITFLLFPILYIKTYKIGLPEAVKPNISTICAPLSLLLAGYLSSFQTPQEAMVIFLLVTSQAMYFFVLVQLPKLLRRPFNPGFSAFTFPYVISATSLRMASIFLHWGKMLSILISAEIVIATLLVSYVLVTYLAYLYKKEVD